MIYLIYCDGHLICHYVECHLLRLLAYRDFPAAIFPFAVAGHSQPQPRDIHKATRSRVALSPSRHPLSFIEQHPNGTLITRPLLPPFLPYSHHHPLSVHPPKFCENKSIVWPQVAAAGNAKTHSDATAAGRRTEVSDGRPSVPAQREPHAPRGPSHARALAGVLYGEGRPPGDVLQAGRESFFFRVAHLPDMGSFLVRLLLMTYVMTGARDGDRRGRS